MQSLDYLSANVFTSLIVKAYLGDFGAEINGKLKSNLLGGIALVAHTNADFPPIAILNDL